MRVLDEDALICDFNEYYHILDFRELPVRLQAVLACGLRDDSRIMMKMSGQKMSIGTMLQAAALDELAFLAWTKTKDAEKGRNRPESVLTKLLGEEKESEIQSFSSADEFERKRREILGRI